MLVFLGNILISFIVFLFFVYVLAKDDFILIRKNISLEEMFNYAFLSGFIAVCAARLFHVFFHPSPLYINPLAFIAFVYFPGLALIGGVIGVVLYVLLLSQKRKIPRGRILDIFSLAFLPGWIVYLLLEQIGNVITKKHFHGESSIVASILLCTSIAAFLLFQKNKTKDGTITLLTLTVFSGTMLILNTLLFAKGTSLLGQEIITTGTVTLICFILLIRQLLLKRR